MFSPGGFDATLESWRTHGLYRRTGCSTASGTVHLHHLRQAGVRRGPGAGWSGSPGRTTSVRASDCSIIWASSGRMSSAAVSAVRSPRPGGGPIPSGSGMVLYSPAGGVKYRMKQHARFAATWPTSGSTAWSGVDVAEERRGLFRRRPAGAVGVGAPPRSGIQPHYRELDAAATEALVTGMARLLFDRDTVPGPNPRSSAAEFRAHRPRRGHSHAPSAARYLQECFPVGSTGTFLWPSRPPRPRPPGSPISWPHFPLRRACRAPDVGAHDGGGLLDVALVHRRDELAVLAVARCPSRALVLHVKRHQRGTVEGSESMTMAALWLAWRPGRGIRPTAHRDRRLLPRGVTAVADLEQLFDVLLGGPFAHQRNDAQFEDLASLGHLRVGHPDRLNRSTIPSPTRALVGAVTKAPPRAPTLIPTMPLASRPRSASRSFTG